MVDTQQNIATIFNIYSNLLKIHLLMHVIAHSNQYAYTILHVYNRCQPCDSIRSVVALEQREQNAASK